MLTRFHPRLLIATALAAVLLAPGLFAQTLAAASNGADASGTSDYTVTTVPGVAFVAAGSGIVYNTSGSIARAVSAAGGQFFAYPGIPAGALIDHIGFNNLNDGTANVMTASLEIRDQGGNVLQIGAVGNSSHASWQTDAGAIAPYVWGGDPAGSGTTLILQLNVSPSSGTQYFGSVEVWWKRVVSPAPASASFNDVPTTHVFFQFIEALKASGITGGCNAAPPLYCPDAPVTRGQMAVFLAKALGLHWPG